MRRRLAQRLDPTRGAGGIEPGAWGCEPSSWPLGQICHTNLTWPKDLYFLGKCKEHSPKITFSKIWPILCHPVCKMLRISPRSFLAWFWSLLFLTFFWTLDFPGMFSPKRGTWQGWRRRRGRRRPPVGGPRPQKYKNMDFGGLGVWGGPPPLTPYIPIGPCSLVTPEQPP